MFKRRRRGGDEERKPALPAPRRTPEADESPGPAVTVAEPASEHDVLLAETVARHFEGAQVHGRVARIGFGGVQIECSVNDVMDLGAQQAASLFLRLSGGPLGPAPIFASVTGYEENPVAAIVAGACNWACTFGPALTAALTGTGRPEVEELETTLDGRRFRVLFNGLDRAMIGDDDPAALIRGARTRAGGTPWLTPVVLEAGRLPLLTASGPSLLSVFVFEGPPGRTVEVKLNGANWGPSCVQAEPVRGGPPGAMILLRELAVLVPLGPAPPILGREAVRRTVDGLADRLEPSQAAGWPGWDAHGGRLGDPLTEAEIAVVQAATGPLPPDYRHFLTQVAGSGAGPGYGLLPPVRVDDAIPLAHAGDGVAWLLRLDEPRFGTVWVEAIGSDGTVAQVAGSFSEWYTAWLDAAVRDLTPWQQWSTAGCATPGVFSQFIEALQSRGELDPDRPADLTGLVSPGAIAITNGDGLLPPGSEGDPCHGCVALADRLGLPPDVFVPGLLSRTEGRG
jgi:hypothetical protein